MISVNKVMNITCLFELDSACVNPRLCISKRQILLSTIHGIGIAHSRREALDDNASHNLDDILIYSNSKEEHVEHGKWIMQCLVDVGLYLNPEKYKFHKQTFKFVSLIISTNAIAMDVGKVQTVQNWSPQDQTANRRLNNLFDIKQLLGFANQY